MHSRQRALLISTLQKLFSWFLFICFMCMDLLNTKANIEVSNLGYSMKNIPSPLKQCYLNIMIDKVESVITRLRWKVHFWYKMEHLVSNADFEFESICTPLQHQLLFNYSINFNPVRNYFHKNLTADINNIKLSGNLLCSLARPQTYLKWHLNKIRLF